MKLRLIVIAALGLALALYLVKYVGLACRADRGRRRSDGAVLRSFACVRWPVPAPRSRLVRIAAASRAARLRVVSLWARMVRDAAAEVLPFSQLGGIVLGARAAILHGVSRPLAFASMIVDVTTEMLAQIAYVALGLAILSARAPRNSLVPHR